MADEHSEVTGETPDTEELHDLATEAERALEGLATALGQIGADPAAVKAVQQMAEVTRKIGSGLAKGMKEQEPERAHSVGSATEEMMADRAASRGPAPDTQTE